MQQLQLLYMSLQGDRHISSGKSHQEAFEKLKEELVNPPTVAYPDPDSIFIFDTDASERFIRRIESDSDPEWQERCYKLCK